VTIHGHPREYLAAIITEIARRSHLRSIVAQTGYEKDGSAWVTRSDVTRAVARILDIPVSVSLGSQVKALLLEDGWKARKHVGVWQWRARLVAPGSADPVTTKREVPARAKRRSSPNR
jgi:hypothetical protein